MSSGEAADGAPGEAGGAAAAVAGAAGGCVGAAVAEGCPGVVGEETAAESAGGGAADDGTEDDCAAAAATRTMTRRPAAARIRTTRKGRRGEPLRTAWLPGRRSRRCWRWISLFDITASTLMTALPVSRPGAAERLPRDERSRVCANCGNEPSAVGRAASCRLRRLTAGPRRDAARRAPVPGGWRRGRREQRWEARRRRCGASTVRPRRARSAATGCGPAAGRRRKLDADGRPSSRSGPAPPGAKRRRPGGLLGDCVLGRVRRSRGSEEV